MLFRTGGGVKAKEGRGSKTYPTDLYQKANRLVFAVEFTLMKMFPLMGVDRQRGQDMDV